MLVYRSAERGASSRELLTTVSATLGSVASHNMTPAIVHERFVALLLDVGALEAACVDAWNVSTDDWDERARAVHALTESLAAAMLTAWSGHLPDLDHVRTALDDASAVDLPDHVCLRVPAGYAYYALYPETYADAAARFHAERAPADVVTVGLRSIGTSLSAVVASALAQRGARVRGVTVRPRGHPFDRELRLEQGVRDALAGSDETWYAVVDEGPGISGSSFAAASRALEQLGISPDRVALFTSREAEAASLRSASARDRWEMHHRYAGHFDDVWVRSGRLSRVFGEGSLRDVSAGRWRSLAFENADDYPATHPRHEQRKFLLQPADGTQPVLLKFVGLGTLGQTRWDLATRLARLGFCASPTSLQAGFLATPWVDGRPMRLEDKTPGFLRHAARYVAHRGRNERAAADVGIESLLEMMAINITGALGEAATPSKATLARWRATFDVSAPVRVDGRLMPHEWLCTAAGWCKTDAVSHHDDHFLPGSQDIAWDVVGLIEEWSLDASERAIFLDAYRQESGDADIDRRLPVWRVAYLAGRVGYATLCRETVDDPDDCARQAKRCAWYTDRLREALTVEAELTYDS